MDDPLFDEDDFVIQKAKMLNMVFESLFGKNKPEFKIINPIKWIVPYVNFKEQIEFFVYTNDLICVVPLPFYTKNSLEN